jgi:uncharacterized membrane protein YtjA (UPF0391 family)
LPFPSRASDEAETILWKQQTRFGSAIASTRAEATKMLHWTLVFLIIALVAGALGLFGVAGAAASIAKILFFVFLVLWLVSFATRRSV